MKYVALSSKSFVYVERLIFEKKNQGCYFLSDVMR